MALVDASCLLTRGFLGDLSVSLSLNLIRGGGLRASKSHRGALPAVVAVPMLAGGEGESSKDWHLLTPRAYLNSQIDDVSKWS
jgi:hypothetical protein